MFRCFPNHTRAYIIVQKFYDEQRDRSALCAIPVLTKERGVDGQKNRGKYAKSQRLRATTSLTKYVNQQGHVTTSFLDIFETYISNNVVNAFRQEGYDNYPFKEYSDITNIFPNIKLTTKNCDE